jgi:hypothetical protein
MPRTLLASAATALIALLATPAAPAAAAVIASFGPEGDYPRFGAAWIGGGHEDGRTVNGTRLLTQSFLMNTSVRVDDIFVLYARGNAGASATVQIYPVADRLADSLQADYDAAVAGGFLLNRPFTMPDTPNDNTVRTLRLTLTDADRTMLSTRPFQAGYALTFKPTSPGVESFTWRLTNQNRDFRVRAYYDTPGEPRFSDDFMLVIQGVPEPASLGLLAMLLPTVMLRRRVACGRATDARLQ